MLFSKDRISLRSSLVSLVWCDSFAHRTTGVVKSVRIHFRLLFGGCSGSFPHLGLYSVQADGTEKKTIKQFTVPSGGSGYLESRQSSPRSIIVSGPQDKDSNSIYYEYKNSALTQLADYGSGDFYQEGERAYLFSPSGTKTAWSDTRDGKSVLFIGDRNAEHGKQVASLQEQYAYGWFTEDYILLSKKSGELYIIGAQGGDPVKISDYYSAPSGYYGYGGV